MRVRWKRKGRSGAALLGALLCMRGPPSLGARDREAPEESGSFEGRIITPGEVKAATHPPALLSLRLLSYPHRRVSAGMEKGLVSFEQRKLREKMQRATEYLSERGIAAHFGGTGERTGLGAGGSYTIHTGEQAALSILGTLTVAGYQEFDAKWSTSGSKNRLIAEASFQWRPHEHFYGLGHSSSKGKHSNFALRQSWTGLRWEIEPTKRLRWGSVYKLAWISALPGQVPGISSPDAFFPSLPGYGRQTRMRSVGAYLDADLVQGEYEWGGLAHLGASYQDGLGESRLRYFSYEAQLEGRMPVASGRSVLAGQANFELNRERGASGAIPFYLLPRIGGSSTLRGFALDRYYGRNLALLSLEYRYRIHPNIQVIPFFDEGQIFDRTSDLAWLNWHWNYGLGLRFRSVQGTFLRLDYGRSSEGFQLHITFGDRERPPLRGPIRYGSYKR